MTRIAVLSDSHDQIWNLEKALAQVRAADASALLHCGDFCAPFVLAQLAEGFSGPIHAVFGNNDGDGRLLQSVAARYDHLTLHGLYAELAIEGHQIAVIHYPEPARRIAQSGHFDLVCYGHDHQAHQEPVGRGWLVNPGEIMGRLGPPSWGLFEAGEYGQMTIEA